MKSEWADLPSDLLSLILSRLTVIDSTTFRAVCKSWRSTTVSAVRPCPFSDSPYMMTLNDSLCKFYNPVYNATYFQKFSELSGMHIRSSNFGWLLMNKDSKMFFFNPFTKNRIDLPDIDKMLYCTRFHFSSPPTSQDCIVLGYGSYQHRAWLQIIKRGELVWKSLGFQNCNKRFFGSCRCAPVFSNGKFYFLGETCRIAVFDVEGEKWEILDGVYKKRHIVWPRSLLVVEEKDGSPEKLLAVFMSHGYRKVHIVRFDLSKMEWEEVKSLGSDEKMLYLSDGGSYLEMSVVRGMGNKIYFPQFHNDDGVLYSLDSGKYHSCDGSYASAVPVDLKEPRQSTWIKPSYLEEVGPVGNAYNHNAAEW